MRQTLELAKLASFCEIHRPDMARCQFIITARYLLFVNGWQVMAAMALANLAISSVSAHHPYPAMVPA
jgi:hypothetical protein